MKSAGRASPFQTTSFAIQFLFWLASPDGVLPVRSFDVEYRLENTSDAGRERVGSVRRRQLKTDRDTARTATGNADRRLAGVVERSRIAERLANIDGPGNRAERGCDQRGSRRGQHVDALERAIDLAVKPVPSRPRSCVEGSTVTIEESPSEIDRATNVIVRG